MKYPRLQELPTARETVEVFKGYNHNLRIGSGEFYDMTNLSSDNYPVLSPRSQRGVYATPLNPSVASIQGLARYDNLCYVDGTKLVVDKYPVEMGLSTDPDDCPKQLIRMGAYLIILPDKKWINLTNLTDFGNIEAEVKTTGVKTTFQTSKVDGSSYENVVVGATAPTITEAMEKGDEEIPLWLDTSGEIHSLKQYSKSMSTWTTIATTYVKISATGIGEPFEVGDGVTISGIENEQLKDLNNTMVIQAKGDNYIVVIGICDKVVEQTTAITAERRMPTMDFVIESENRLWGCHYGIAQNGEMVNEIYASKQGDFKNWHCYAGISTDSYAATVGTDGQFTGAITHLGYPLFFKENYIHKVYGNFPSNYQINTTACRGVQKYSHKSLAIVNEVLYYKSRSGICSYDGSLPQEISYAMGEETYSEAVAGSHGNKYYISMKSDKSGEWNLFVYDAAKGMWHREDDTQADAFCDCRGDLYYIDHADNCIKTVRGTGATETAPIQWQAVTGIIGTDSPDKKYISRMDVRMSLAVGARVSFFAEYDSSGEWEYLFAMDGVKLRTFAVPIRPQRCDHMRLKIVGNGEAKIYSICKTIEQGSDV